MAAAIPSLYRSLLSSPLRRVFLVATFSLLSFAQASAVAVQADGERASFRGTRYCEIFFFYPAHGSVRVEVWGTQGLGDCPSDSWDALDAGSLRDEFGAVAVRLNGPRFFLMDRAQHATLRESPQRRVGELEMRQIGTVVLALGADAGQRYVERTIERETIYEFWAGFDVYELVAPDGSVYVMQSYNQIVATDLDESELSQLGSRLQLPGGWTFRHRTLDEPLEVRADGLAIVVQDDLDNTYQRYVEGTLVPAAANGLPSGRREPFF